LIRHWYYCRLIRWCCLRYYSLIAISLCLRHYAAYCFIFSIYSLLRHYSFSFLIFSLPLHYAIAIFIFFSLHIAIIIDIYAISWLHYITFITPFIFFTLIIYYAIIIMPLLFIAFRLRHYCIVFLLDICYQIITHRGLPLYWIFSLFSFLPLFTIASLPFTFLLSLPFITLADCRY